MILRCSRRAWTDWPRITEPGSGTHASLSCRCVTLSRWVALQRFGFVAWSVIGLSLVLSASMGLWVQPVASATDGTPAYAMLAKLAEPRHWLHELLVGRYPEVGKALMYDYRRPLDWHLLALGIVIFRLKGPLTGLFTRVVSFMVRPAMAPRLKVSADAELIRIRRGLRTQTIRRGGGLHEARFRAVSATEYYPGLARERLQTQPLLRPLIDIPPAVLELATSTSRRKLLLLRRGDQAEAIAARGNELLTMTGLTSRMPGMR